MAYDKKSIRVVAGGLVKTIPGDNIQDDESQELLNFTTDSLGALHSRRGHQVRCSSLAVNMIHALGALWIGSAGGVGPNCGSVLPGGDPLGLMSWKDFIWSTGGAMRKSDGSNNWRWIPEAPQDKPTVKPSAGAETTVVDFGPTWTVIDPAGAENYNPGLQFTATEDGIAYSAEKTIAVDLETGKSLDEVHKITVFSKNWDKIKEVVFEVDCNGGDFTTDYFTARMKRKNILGGLKEEVTFYVRARPFAVDDAAKDKKRYGAFERIGSTPEKGWKTCVKARVKVKFIETTRIRFVSWVAVGDENATLEGDNYQVCYTYTTDAGHESNPSPFSDACTCNRSGIQVDGMQVSGDPQVTGMNVYLQGGTLGGIYRVNRDPIAPSSSYTITASENDLTDFGIQLENDHDDPPAAEGLIGPYFGRAIAWKGNRYYWSHVKKPYAFAQPDGEFGDWAQLEEGLGDIKAATMRPGTLWFHCENGVAILQGDPGGPASAQHRASVQMGIRSPQGVVQAPEGDYANMSEGVFRFNGDSASEISRKIQTIFKSGWNASNAALGFRNGVVWASDGAQTYRYDTLTDRWFQDSRLFTAFYSDGGSLMGGMTNGQVVELETGFDDDGAPMSLVWQSKAYDCDLKSDEKRFGDFEIWANTQGAGLTVQAILSDPDQTITLGVIASSSEERFVLPFSADGEGIDARKCAIRITGSTSFEVTIFAMQLWWYPKAREGKSFDTGEQSYGTHRVKLLRELVLDVDNPAAVGITVKSDRPQPMADRDTTQSIAVTTDRRMQPIVFEEEIIGRLFRTVLHGADFLCYGGKALIQVFGTYLEGGDGEYYLSDVLDFGSERIKLLKECEVVYSSSAQATLTVETDQPGDALVTRTTFTLPATTGEESIKLRFAGTVKGRLVRFRLTPSADLRLEAIRVWLKFIGAPNATPWQWVSLPVAATQDAIWQDIGFPLDAPG